MKSQNFKFHMDISDGRKWDADKIKEVLAIIFWLIICLWKCQVQEKPWDNVDRLIKEGLCACGMLWEYKVLQMTTDFYRFLGTGGKHIS